MVGRKWDCPLLARRCFAVLLTVVCLAWTAFAVAGDQATPDQPSSGKLKWVPYRPDAVQDASRASDAGRVVPASATEPVQSDQQPAATRCNDPFDDPFEDEKEIRHPIATWIRRSVAQRSAEPETPPSVAPPRAGSAESSATSRRLDEPEPLPGGRRLQTIEESIVRHPAPLDKCPSPKDLKPIRKITSNVAAESGDFPPECGLDNPSFQTRCWGQKTFTWTASGLCHKPLYFEDEQLERYGHSRLPLLQPIISPVKFFVSAPLLPYKMGLTPPNECIYTLGYYRPGDRAPYLTDPIPLSVRGALFEGAAVGTGLAALP